MKANVFGAIVASTLLGWGGVSFAQTSYGSGESARCNTMSGEEKEQCLRDEANKAQGTPKEIKESTGKETLEDAFLALTGSSIRAEEADPAAMMRQFAQMWQQNKR